MVGGDADWKRLIEEEVATLRRQVDSLRLWRASTLGMAVVIAWIVGEFSRYLPEILRHVG